jgi:hypothetical protein
LRTLVRPDRRQTVRWQDIPIEAAEMRIASAQSDNLLDFVLAAQGLSQPQSMTLNEHDGGISLHWLDRNFEIAVYHDRFETYQFSDRETVIRHWPHTPGEHVDEYFLAEFVAIVTEGAA